MVSAKNETKAKEKMKIEKSKDFRQIYASIYEEEWKKEAAKIFKRGPMAGLSRRQKRRKMLMREIEKDSKGTEGIKDK